MKNLLSLSILLLFSAHMFGQNPVLALEKMNVLDSSNSSHNFHFYNN